MELNIKELRDRFNKSQQRVADETGISRDKIAKWETTSHKPKTEDYIKLKNYFESLAKYSGDNSVSLKFSQAENQGQPILDIRVCAGHGIGLEGDENKIIEWVNIPKFDGCYGVTVYGDSMYDKFKSGDIIFVRPIQGRNDFDFGQCYVVITNEDRYIKNIYESGKGDEYVTMTSFNIEINPDGRRRFPDKDILIEDIKHLYKVAGKLRRDQL